GPIDAWAVGWSRGALHWDGAQWNTVALPPYAQDQVDVSALSANDVWAAGVGTITHWDGTAWSFVPYPTPTPLPKAHYNFYAIKARDPYEVLAAGSCHSVIGF